MLNWVSVPSDFPYIDIAVNDNPDTGFIFCNFAGNRYYNLILDNNGDPVFYWIVPDDRRDFKVQETGVLTMTVRQGFGGGGYIALDNTYAVVDTFFAPSGYTIDEHELLVLPNGHYLVTAIDHRFIDMSQIVPGGKRNADVTGYHLIEMDSHDNPVFIWRCWDKHYEITDADQRYVDLTQYNIDFLHMNSIAVDLDGNYLICPKLLNEITKINRNTGDIIWRLGGKRNQFKYVGMTDFIYMQHSIRVLPNGNYTVFDNGNYHNPPYSRALEFKVNTDDMTVTKIWEFRDTPDKYSSYQGNVQRLPNGNTLINWALPYYPKLTEVKPDGAKTFEMNFFDSVTCYRVFRFPWHGKAAVPFLVIEPRTDKVTLLFNKFGDSDVKEYRVYGGPHAHPNNLMRIASVPYLNLDENDFTESQTYYFRVTAVDSRGNESGFSNEEEVRTSFIPAGINMITNGEFNAATTGWSFNVKGSASASMNSDNHECHIIIQKNGIDLAEVQLIQNNLVLYQGQPYVFEFDAWADHARAIDAKIESTVPPYTNYGEIGLTSLKFNRQRYTFIFNMENSTTKQTRVVFNIGLVQGEVYIDNVVLMRLPPSGITAEQSAHHPNEFLLNPIYPNPFNQDAIISFTVPTQSFIIVEIFDILGRTVEIITQEILAPGRYIRQFHGDRFSSGIYFCRLRARAVTSGQESCQVRRMMLLK